MRNPLAAVGWTFLVLGVTTAAAGVFAVLQPEGPVAQLTWVRDYTALGVFVLAGSLLAVGLSALALARRHSARHAVLARVGWAMLVGGLAFLLFVPASCSVGSADGIGTSWQGTRCVTLSGLTFTSDDFLGWVGLYGLAMSIGVALVTFAVLSVLGIPGRSYTCRWSAGTAVPSASG